MCVARKHAYNIIFRLDCQIIVLFWIDKKKFMLFLLFINSCMFSSHVPPNS